MKSKLVIVYPDAERDELNRYDALFNRLRAFSEFEIFTGKPADNREYAKRIRNADGILLGWSLPGEVMRHARNLKVISFSGVGAEQFIDMDQVGERGITVCNCPGYSNNAVAEHTLALLLNLARHVSRLDRSLRRGAWNQSIDGFELRGKTIGIIGFGGIGRTFSKMCEALGMEVLMWTRNISTERARQHDVKFVSFETLLQKSDVISLHAAFNADTENLFNRDVISQMKDGVLFINTARGELAEETALIDGLESGKIAGAGLDVYWREPLRGDHPLTSMENVVLSPHVAFNTPEAVDNLFEIAVNNLVQFFNGTPVNTVQG